MYKKSLYPNPPKIYIYGNSVKNYIESLPGYFCLDKNHNGILNNTFYVYFIEDDNYKNKNIIECIGEYFHTEFKQNLKDPFEIPEINFDKEKKYILKFIIKFKFDMDNNLKTCEYGFENSEKYQNIYEIIE